MEMKNELRKAIVKKVVNEHIEKGAYLELHSDVDDACVYNIYDKNIAQAYLTDGTRKLFHQSSFYYPENTPNGGLLNTFDKEKKEDLYNWVLENAEAIILLGDYCSELSFDDWKQIVEEVTKIRGGNHLKWTHDWNCWYFCDQKFWSISNN